MILESCRNYSFLLEAIQEIRKYWCLLHLHRGQKDYHLPKSQPCLLTVMNFPQHYWYGHWWRYLCNFFRNLRICLCCASYFIFLEFSHWQNRRACFQWLNRLNFEKCHRWCASSLRRSKMNQFCSRTYWWFCHTPTSSIENHSFFLIEFLPYRFSTPWERLKFDFAVPKYFDPIEFFNPLLE